MSPSSSSCRRRLLAAAQPRRVPSDGRRRGLPAVLAHLPRHVRPLPHRLRLPPGQDAAPAAEGDPGQGREAPQGPAAATAAAATAQAARHHQDPEQAAQPPRCCCSCRRQEEAASEGLTVAGERRAGLCASGIQVLSNESVWCLNTAAMKLHRFTARVDVQFVAPHCLEHVWN